ncbi:Cytochrome P450 107B1 [BD1-7 clade bacterium]|uniref:Cytochrome P450 107B1 n=1 Tax=BD1-7 clade bacterium TaxID=2029982 RepID=A0A5S9N1N7_9GAMM|nr:Cytochrome P450 107B1 [BD1-7 clade bacterium]CAA0083050.1 Cytochrome P450 107B1 [BD1-7 clade bacterium]
MNVVLKLSGPQFDTKDMTFRKNPMAVFEQLREKWPIFHHQQLDAWICTRHEDVTQFLRDDRVSTDFTIARNGPQKKPIEKQSGFEKIFTFGTAQLSRADHQRIRKLALPAFSTELLEPTTHRLTKLAHSLIDNTVGIQRFNFADKIAGKMPIASICELLQITVDDQHFDDFITFVVILLQSANNMYPDMENREHNAILAQPGYEFICSIIEKRRNHLKQDDFLSYLIMANEEGDTISNDELVSLVCALLTAGTSSAVHLQNRLIWNLHKHPDEDQKLRRNPSLIQSAIQEVLRFNFFDSPNMIGIRRYAIEDFTWKDQCIRRGDTIMLQMGAAHRDPRAFENSDQFIIERNQTNNRVFGIGPHFCMGNMLARAEVEAIYRALIERYPDYCVDGIEYLADEPTEEKALWMKPSSH